MKTLFALSFVLISSDFGFSKETNTSAPDWPPVAFVSDTSCRTLGNGGRICKMIVSGPSGIPDANYATSVDKIQFSLHDGKRNFRCSKTRVHSSDSSSSWQGQCNGDGAIEATFVTRTDEVTGKRGLFGSLNLGDTICRTRYGAASFEDQEIVCLPADSFPREADPIVPDPSHRFLQSVNGISINTQDSLPSTGKTMKKRQTHRALGEVVTDLLVVWTKAAECLNSGYEVGCTTSNITTSNMRGLIDLAVTESNNAFEASGSIIRLNLVHAYCESSYVEISGNQTIEIALHDISFIDGVIDVVHSKRTQYGADLVVFLVESPTWCGIAWVGGGRKYTFSVTDWKCTVGFYSFVHEIAHNYGCLHDRGSEDACDKLGYTYGWRDPQANFRTIMAYDCESGQCDSHPGGNCPRIGRFSSASQTYDGKPLGNDMNDNVRMLNEKAVDTANYYSPSSTKPTSHPTSKPSFNPTKRPTETSKPSPGPTSRSTTCRNEEESCSEWGTCCEGLFCNKQKGLCKICITENRPCHRSIQCCLTNACINRLCTACIEVGGVCSSTEDCCQENGFSCVEGKCIHF